MSNPTQSLPLPPRATFALSEVLSRYLDTPYTPGDSLGEFTPWHHTVSSARSHGYVFSTRRDERGLLVEDGPATRVRNEAYHVTLVTSEPALRSVYDERPGENIVTPFDLEVEGPGRDGEVKTWRFAGDLAWLEAARGWWNGCTWDALHEAYLVMEDYIIAMGQQ